MHLTPSMLEAAYEYLRTTPPFNRWKLPHADEIEFAITRHRDRRGDCRAEPRVSARIRISTYYIYTTDELMAVMAHEMCHLHVTSGPDHGSGWRAAARSTCNQHGWELDTF